MPATESSSLPESPATESSVTKVIRPIERALPVARLTGPSWPCVRGYEILSVIGSGGMGIVYKAQHRDLRRTVALKMLRGEALADPEFHCRFQAEAEAVAKLQHPNIIQVFEIGAVEPFTGELYSSPFISLEFVDGGSLTRRTDRPQPPRDAAEMVEKLARAVHSAHRLGVVHRDLKPANVLLTRAGEPKIADFGLAKQLGAERDAGGRFLTQAGIVVGTPEYMAPEQATGDAPTTAVDIYALGVILYEMLTAQVPFTAASPAETIRAMQRREPVPPRQLQPGLARDLETICLKCLEKEPGKRYATAEALADDLRCYLDNRPIAARRVTEIERLARWCRRNPGVAASLAGVAGIFLAAFVLVSLSYWRAEAAWHEEALQRHEAQRREKAERWERYRANLVATSSAFQVYNVGSARRTLADAPHDYRNWEWRHFQSRLDLAHHVLHTDDAAITEAGIALNGNRAVLKGEAGFVRVWDTIARKEVRTFHNAQELHRAALSCDGKTFAYITKDNAIELRDVDSGRVRTITLGAQRIIHSVQFTADASHVCAAADDQNVRVWDVATGALHRTLGPCQFGFGSGVRISPDGRRVVTSNQNGSEVHLWDVDTGNELAVLSGHKHHLIAVHFNRPADRVVTVEGYPGNDLRLWNASTGQLIGVLSGHSSHVTDVVFNADGTRIASSSLDQTIRLWDGATGQLVAPLKGHNGRVNTLAFSKNGKHLVSGSEDHTLRVWDSAMGTELAVLNGHTAAVHGVAYTPDGNHIVSVSADGALRLWDSQTVVSNGILRGHSTFVYAIAFHPDGERVASASWDGTVGIWDLTTGQRKALLNHGENTIVSSVAIHPDGRLLASRARGWVVLWDLASGRELHRWPALSDSWRDTRLAFSPKGGLLASGCRGNEVRLWDVNTRAEVAVLKGHRGEVLDVVFSPDGKWLASAAADKSIRIWDVANKEQVHTLEGHRDSVYALAFSRDGARLASGSLDGTARLWDTETWRENAMLKHGSNVYGVAFTPDGTRLACACADNSIRFWDVATHQSVAELRGHTGYVHALAFSPDGSRLVSASGDAAVRVWDTVRPQDRVRGQ